MVLVYLVYKGWQNEEQVVIEVYKDEQKADDRVRLEEEGNEKKNIYFFQEARRVIE